MPRPTTTRSVADEIARSYDKFDRAQLVNILSYLTKTYVVDGTMPFTIPGEGGKLGGVEGEEKELDFPKLIDQLKKRLPKLKELSYFQVEDGKVVLRAGNQKITFGERVITEFAAAAPAAPPPAPVERPVERPAPERHVGPERAVGAAAAAARKQAAQKTPEKEAGPSLSDTQQEALNDIASRFSGLELD